ncbi:MAG: 50S ribosomal protein L18 [Candidatus Yonathbacteria bacterium RIFCSPHIGHO2_01_FULL_51_10]|uniref:Large ribosomal subunit protein uL18 n=1 Tax=Candidatus Yonathbacteria bacterium RIFCSPHIGHO2_01_FULL_51_10 TaxID=1802723 RepID=A0A1G2S7P4_9BACT|nr:MAG: 50S ribosomal protein L18 [Candidatus Yonathbacteria bacterium RIFCSPHIGHO2_01_FULL_51_10]
MNTKGTKKTQGRARRQARVRAKVSGTHAVPRLSVYKSNRFMYAQLIDDTTGKTLAAASDMGGGKGNKVERASAVGKALAKAAQEKKITKVVFDRGGFRYMGRVKALADGAREGGLVF